MSEQIIDFDFNSLDAFPAFFTTSTTPSRSPASTDLRQTSEVDLSGRHGGNMPDLVPSSHHLVNNNQVKLKPIKLRALETRAGMQSSCYKLA